MALTNRSEVQFYFEPIVRDFDLYIVTKESKHLERTNILDIPQERFKALSVVYSYGAHAYVLFVKDSIDPTAFRDAITETYKDVTIQKVRLSDLQSEAFCQKYFYYGNRMLAQLLINSIRVPRNKQFAYNNLTGKLYYGCSDWVESWGDESKKIMRLSFLQISFDKGMYLNLDVKTFKRVDPAFETKSRKYVFDKATQQFRRMLATDKTQDIFIEGNFKGRRKTIPFLNISNFSVYSKCRMGVLCRFLADVQEQLGEYMTITLLPRDNIQVYQETHKLKKEASHAFMGGILGEKGVNIVDLVQTPKSEELSCYLAEVLLNRYNVSVCTGQLDASAYNIRIIHNEEFYEQNNMADPHEDDLGVTIVQHVTVESLDDAKAKKKGKNKDSDKEKEDRKAKAATICNKVVQELILKNDVRQRRISIYDWPHLCFDKTWSFVSREKIREEGNEADNTQSESAAKTNGKEKFKPQYRYHMVQITPDGEMTFSSFGEADSELCPDFDNLSHQMRNYGEIEGFAFSDPDNIHVIVSSKEKTMPDITAIWNGLRDTDDRELVERDKLIDAIGTCVQDEPAELREYANEVITQMKQQEPLIKKKDLRSIIGIRKSNGKKLNRLLRDKCGIWIFSEIRSEEFESTYCLSDIADIKWFSETDDNGVYFFNYFVGPKRKGMDCSVQNASVIRKIYTSEGDIEFQELLPLMCTEFVRNGMYTVLPFPFKYLREYKKMNSL